MSPIIGGEAISHMDKTRICRITPVQGWGWIGKPPPSDRDTPEPFDLAHVRRADDGWKGEVDTAGHEFHGMTALFTQRHVEWDGLVNLSVFSGSEKAGDG